MDRLPPECVLTSMLMPAGSTQLVIAAVDEAGIDNGGFLSEFIRPDTRAVLRCVIASGMV